jgi:hypothetical protein
MNLLSAAAVLRGQLSLYAPVNLWWARNFFEAVDLSAIVSANLDDKVLEEKAGAVRMWRHIEELAGRIEYPSPEMRQFVTTSAAYGRLKYELIQQAWIILLCGQRADRNLPFDRAALAAALIRYDQLWKEWFGLRAWNPACSTIYKDVGFLGRPGLGAAVAKYRKLLAPATEH